MEKTRHRKRILIVGAGVAGQEVLRELRRQVVLNCQPVGFIDDDYKKTGIFVSGIKVLGPIKDLNKITKDKKIEEVFIAIPSGSGQLIRRIIKRCQDSEIKFRIIPRVLEIIEGRVRWPQVRELKPEDLLGRAIVKTDLRPVKKAIKNKTLLITGAAGSIGSEIARQLAIFSPKLVICLDWWENGLYQLERELKSKFPRVNFKFIIANIQDVGRLDHCLKKYKPEIIFHAAAYKHVPAMEENPSEAVKNNIFATYELAKLAIKNGVKNLIFLSTDKAVNPASVMGVSKLFAEQLLQNFNKDDKTKFISVRFGNVLASYGSVIPIFEKQILNGGPVTVTDSRSLRYFMTISEAVQLILQALTIGQGGEIFALEMGEPIKIIDLTHDLIRFYGLSPKKIKVKKIGLRPGEKLLEEDLTKQRGIVPTGIKKIYLFKNNPQNFKKLKLDLKKLKEAIRSDDNKELIYILRKTLPSFKPARK